MTNRGRYLPPYSVVLTDTVRDFLYLCPDDGRKAEYRKKQEFRLCTKRLFALTKPVAVAGHRVSPYELMKTRYPVIGPAMIRLTEHMPGISENPYRSGIICRS